MSPEELEGVVAAAVALKQAIDTLRELGQPWEHLELAFCDLPQEVGAIATTIHNHELRQGGPPPPPDRRDLRAIVSHALDVGDEHMDRDCVLCAAIARVLGMDLSNKFDGPPPESES